MIYVNQPNTLTCMIRTKCIRHHTIETNKESSRSNKIIFYKYFKKLNILEWDTKWFPNQCNFITMVKTRKEVKENKEKISSSIWVFYFAFMF